MPFATSASCVCAQSSRWCRPDSDAAGGRRGDAACPWSSRAWRSGTPRRPPRRHQRAQGQGQGCGPDRLRRAAACELRSFPATAGAQARGSSTSAIMGARERASSTPDAGERAQGSFDDLNNIDGEFGVPDEGELADQRRKNR